MKLALLKAYIGKLPGDEKKPLASCCSLLTGTEHELHVSSAANE